jgi:hypothetical protein
MLVKKASLHVLTVSAYCAHGLKNSKDCLCVTLLGFALWGLALRWSGATMCLRYDRPMRGSKASPLTVNMTLRSWDGSSNRMGCCRWSMSVCQVHFTRKMIMFSHKQS